MDDMKLFRLCIKKKLPKQFVELSRMSLSCQKILITKTLGTMAHECLASIAGPCRFLDSRKVLKFLRP